MSWLFFGGGVSGVFQMDEFFWSYNARAKSQVYPGWLSCIEMHSLAFSFVNYKSEYQFSAHLAYVQIFQYPCKPVVYCNVFCNLLEWQSQTGSDLYVFYELRTFSKLFLPSKHKWTVAFTFTGLLKHVIGMCWCFPKRISDLNYCP
jgi:hypothetical protein